jgi:hypothetical protein
VHADIASAMPKPSVHVPRQVVSRSKQYSTNPFDRTLFIWIGVFAGRNNLIADITMVYSHRAKFLLLVIVPGKGPECELTCSR